MTAKRVMRYVLGVSFMIAGANHFLHTAFYVSIMPDYVPWHTALVHVSGVAEMALGAMLFVPAVERLAAWGTMALMIAVFPANLQMALHSELYPQFSALALWLRVPFQIVLVAWAYWLTRRDPIARLTEHAH